MSRLTDLEIKLRHGFCAGSGCPICNDLTFGEIVRSLRARNFHVMAFEDNGEGYSYVHVLEDEAACSRLLSGEVGDSNSFGAA